MENETTMIKRAFQVMLQAYLRGYISPVYKLHSLLYCATLYMNKYAIYKYVYIEYIHSIHRYIIGLPLQYSLFY